MLIRAVQQQLQWHLLHPWGMAPLWRLPLGVPEQQQQQQQQQQQCGLDRQQSCQLLELRHQQLSRQAHHTPCSHQQQQQQQQSTSLAVHKIYRGNWILPVRFLVRAKVFQLMGGGSIGLAVASWTMEEATMGDVFALTALAGGMVAASCCLWYYSRRYVGEMSLLLPDRQRVRFSVLDFWGNRENVDVPVSAIEPPFKDIRKKEMERLANQLLFPVNVKGCRQFYLSIHAGHIMEPQIFLSILKGEYDPQTLGQPEIHQQHQHSQHDPSQQNGKQPPQPEAESLQQQREQQQQQQQQLLLQQAASTSSIVPQAEQQPAISSAQTEQSCVADQPVHNQQQHQSQPSQQQPSQPSQEGDSQQLRPTQTMW